MTTNPYPRLLSQAHYEQLLANGRISQNGESHDPFPVVKLFTPDAGATWLLTELDPDEPSRAFGLCDLGLGYPELGYVSLDELATVCGNMGLRIEADAHFQASKPLSHYADEARQNERVMV